MQTPAVVPIPHVGGPILPPGQPTVLIAGMPAAVVGDMCVCVGPPDAIAMGSTGVMIGGRPAARMGDMTIHGGSIVMGCPTVLIGETGSAGGGGGGAGAGGGAVAAMGAASGAAAAAVAAESAAAEKTKSAVEAVEQRHKDGAFSSPPIDPTKQAWVEIEVVDEIGGPVAYERYRIQIPSGETREGWTDANGIARLEGLVDGTCQISLPDLDEKAWGPA